MIVTAGILRETNPEAIERIQETKNNITSNITLITNLYRRSLKDDIKYGKPYRPNINFELEPEERLNWETHSERRIRPKYRTNRSQRRIEKTETIIKLTENGANITEIKETVANDCSLIGEARRRVFWNRVKY